MQSRWASGAHEAAHDLNGPELIGTGNETGWPTGGPGKHLVPGSLLLSAGAQLALLGGALLIISASLRSGLQLSWHFLVAALGCYGIVCALVLIGLPRHAPHRWFGVANSVTLTRAFLTALLWGVVAEQSVGNMPVLNPTARWLVVFAATAALLSDGLDGWAARRSGMASGFGAHFDMEVDALFLLALAMLVYATNEVGAWVIASGVLRYAFVISSYVWPWLAAPLLPLWRRKAICVLQVAVLIVALVPIAPIWATQLLCLGGLAALCGSFGSDLVWLASRSQA